MLSVVVLHMFQTGYKSVSNNVSIGSRMMAKASLLSNKYQHPISEISDTCISSRDVDASVLGFDALVLWVSASVLASWPQSQA